jgi:prepilin-type N-terminal cleavage/methylation domain-containing protein
VKTQNLHARVSQCARNLDGFTLIELMITVAIVAILTAIAYPSYRNYVLRGQVVSATNALSSMSANMERYFQDNRQYTSLTAGTAPMSPCDPAQLATSNTAGTFTLTCPTYSTTSFTITATGTNGGATQGFSYSIDQAGNQSSAVVSPAPSAWRLTCASTWETRAGSC